jgi:hypothetical protein
MAMKNKLLYTAVACTFLAVASAGWMIRRHILHLQYQPPTTELNNKACDTTGLVGYWQFDSVLNDGTPDASNLDHHGVLKMKGLQLSRLIFGYPKLVDGKVGRALEFSGKQWVSVGNDQCFVAEQSTLAAWVWQESDDEQRVPVPTIMAKSSWPTNGWWLCSTTQGIQAASRYIDLGIAWGNGMTHVESGYRLPLKEWHHIAVTLDNLSHQAQFYIDGKAFGTLHVNVPHWLTNRDHDLFVGEYDGSGRWPWVGKLDEVRIYNRVLTAAEIALVFSGAS